MFWIRVASDLADSPKIGALARELRVNRDTAFARLVTLWGWVARHAPTGDLGSVPDSEVAHGAKWRGRPERFVAGLQASGLMDHRIIHDWERMNGRSLAECSRVKLWKEKQRLQRQKDEAVTRNVTQPITCIRNVTERNVTTTQQETAMSAAADAPEFEAVWKAYHEERRKVSIKKATMDRCKSIVAKGRASWQQLADAARRYATACQQAGTESRFVQHAEVFFGDGKGQWENALRDTFIAEYFAAHNGGNHGNGTGAPGRRADSGRSFAAAAEQAGKFAGK